MAKNGASRCQSSDEGNETPKKITYSINTIFLTAFLLVSLKAQLHAFVLFSSATLNGPDNGPDGATAVTTDSSGNIWVTGYVDAGAELLNVWIGKYDPSLILLSSTTFNGSGNGMDMGNDITIDSSGNVWVTGKVNETIGGTNIWIAKYSPSLVLLSSTTFDGPANEDEESYAITIDPNSDVWVTGFIAKDIFDGDLWIGKYSSSLVLQASTTINGSDDALDSGRAITVDAAGYIWLTGFVREIDEFRNIWIAKYDSSMVLISSITIDGSSSGFDMGEGITTDEENNVWVTGFINETPGSQNIWIAKYNSSQLLLASTTFDGSANSSDQGNGIAIDAYGNVGVTGIVFEIMGSMNIWLGKYDSSLILQSSITVNGSANDMDIGIDIMFDGTGNVYVTGIIDETSELENIWIAKYDLRTETPVSFVGTTLGTSSITWSWVDQKNEDGFRVISSTGGNMSGDLASDTLTWTETGLSTNIAYTRLLAAFNEFGASTSTAVTVYTAAAVPVAATFTNVSTMSLQANWTANDNPLGTTYYAVISTGSFPSINGFTSNLSSTTLNTLAVFSGLSPNTTYYAEVKAINHDGVGTAFDSLGSTVTAPGPPTGLSGTALGTSSITWAWTAVPGALKYKVYDLSDNPLDTNVTTNSYTQMSLSTNTSHGIMVSVVNASGESSRSATVSLFTLAAPPTGFSFVEVRLTFATVSWQANNNSVGTTYEVVYWTTGSTKTVTVVAQTSATITGLGGGTTVYATARAINGDGIPTAYDVTQSTFIRATVQTIDPDQDNTVKFTGPSGEIKLEIPVNAFSAAIQVTLRVPDPATVPSDADGIKALTTPVVIEILLDQNVQPSKDVMLTAAYQDSDLGTADEDKLVVARYDTAHSAWVPLFSIRDKINNKVIALTDHFSIFQIMEVSPAQSFGSVTVGPIPWMASQNPNTPITFRNLPSGAKVRIYTYLGELVYETMEDGTGMAVWTGKNQAGQQVASGVYIVLLTAGSDKETLKVVVER